MSVSKEDIARWIDGHGPELGGVPVHLRESLAWKVLAEHYDIESGLSRGGIAKREIKKESEIFFLDHMVRFARIEDVESVLSDTLRSRLQNSFEEKRLEDADLIEQVVWRYAEPLIFGKQQYNGGFCIEEEVGWAIPRVTSNEVSALADWCLIRNGQDTFTVLWPCTDWTRGEHVHRMPNFTSRRWSKLLRAEKYFIRDKTDEWQWTKEKVSRQVISKESKEEHDYIQPALVSPVRVYTDREWVGKHLRDSRFQIISTPAEEADVLFLSSGGRHTGSKKEEHYVSWYDYEAALIRKDHLAQLITESGLHDLAPLSFDLETQLEEALAAIQSGDLGDTYVLKPNNLGRSIGVVLTSSVAAVIAHARGPYIIQKYIHSPASLLSDGRKFDIRMVVLLRSSSPLELYAHNRIFIRAASHAMQNNNQKPSPEQFLTTPHLAFSHTEKHPSNQVLIAHLGPDRYSCILQHARHRAALVFAAAAEKYPGFAASSKKSRAIYGCDFILNEFYYPTLLEVTFDPSYLADHPAFPDPEPDFADDCLSCLFFGETHNITRCLLKRPPPLE